MKNSKINGGGSGRGSGGDRRVGRGGGGVRADVKEEVNCCEKFNKKFRGGGFGVGSWWI